MSKYFLLPLFFFLPPPPHSNSPFHSKLFFLHSLFFFLFFRSYDNTNDNGQADPYTACVYRALANGWHKDRVGSHSVRGNHIHHCGQTGVVGSLGGAFSTVVGNHIHDCNWGQTFGGAEMACIKLHAAVDVVIQDNHLYNCSSFGIWLDWMAQG